MSKKESFFQPSRVIAIGFILIVLVGTLLLSLPISRNEGVEYSFLNSVFTATSATCVTGLIKADTFSYWSSFGQGIILALIQIGGIGFISIGVLALLIFKKKIDFSARLLIQSAFSTPQIGGMVKITKFVLIMTAATEGIGALLLSFFYVPKFGFGKGIWYSVFHSISAYCNAGFDLMGYEEPGSSLTTMQGNWYFYIVIMLLIIFGGIGFFVWENIIQSKFRFSKFQFQTKIVIIVSISLIILGGVVLFLTEYNTDTFKNLSTGDKILASLFQSVSARTAGFNSIDLGTMSESGKLVMILLMLIGGSPGSTAGGIKTTTILILLLTIPSSFKKRKNVEVFGRRIDDSAVRTSVCIITLYLLLAGIGAIIISSTNNISMIDSLFETISAVATVGLTTGITASLNLVSSIYLIMLMLIGRIGSITILMAIAPNNSTISTLPQEPVQVG